MPGAVFVPAALNDLAVDVALSGAARGDVFFRGATRWNNLPAGTSGQFLKTQGAGANPTWSGLAASDLAPAVILAPGASARNVIQPTGDFVKLVLKAFGTPTVNYLEFQDSGGVVKSSVDATCQFDTTGANLIGNAAQSCSVATDMTANNIYLASNAAYSASSGFWNKLVAARTAIFGSAGTGVNKGFYVYTSDSTTLGQITDFVDRMHVLANGVCSISGALQVGIASSLFETFISKATATNLVAIRARAFSSSSTSNVIEVQNSTPVNLFQVSPAGLTTATLRDATTNVISDALIIDHATSGTPAAGFGQQLRFKSQSSTTVSRNTGLVSSAWVVATDASRTGRMRAWASDATADRECIRWETDGTNAMVGFLGANATARVAITGSRGGNAALASLLTELASKGLITDSTTA